MMAQWTAEQATTPQPRAQIHHPHHGHIDVLLRVQQ
jgi:hypothetical protein